MRKSLLLATNLCLILTTKQSSQDCAQIMKLTRNLYMWKIIWGRATKCAQIMKSFFVDRKIGVRRTVYSLLEGRSYFFFFFPFFFFVNNGQSWYFADTNELSCISIDEIYSLVNYLTFLSVNCFCEVWGVGSCGWMLLIQK